jgi:HSP20 family molecular chaperone IbpA
LKKWKNNIMRGDEMYEDPQDMFREMDELFARLYARMTRDFAAGEPQVFGYHTVIRRDGESLPVLCSQRNQLREGTGPVAEVHRIGDEVKVITELPGATMDAIRLEIQDQTLIIDSDGGNLSYHTTAALPPVDPDSIQTSFKNGVLEVTFGILPGIS